KLMERGKLPGRVRDSPSGAEGSHIGDSELEEGAVRLCHVVDDLRLISEYISDMVFKLRIFPFDKTGVLPGDENFIAGSFFQLPHDAVCKGVRNDSAGDDFSPVDAEGTVLCDV